MSLDLRPDIESRVLEYAAAEGISVNELIGRAFPPRKAQFDQKTLDLMAAIRQWQTEDATDDPDELDRREQETAAHHAALDQSRHEAGMRLLFPNRTQP